MLKHFLQKILVLAVIALLVLIPISPAFQFQKAEADVLDIDNDTAQTFIATAGAYYAARCTIVGRVLGLDQILANAESFIGDLAAGAVAAAGSFVGGLLRQIPGVGGIAGGVVESVSSGGSASDAAAAAAREQAKSQAVPVNVEFLPGTVESDIATIKKGVKVSAEGTKQDNQNSLCDSINRALSNVIKQQILNRAVNDITDWIEGGFQGPIFVDNWKTYLQDAGSAAVGGIAREVGLGRLCSPFNLQISVVLAPVPKFSEKATCTLDDIVANIQNFYDDFRNGGWIAYQESWRPQNNIFGLALLAVDEAAQREDAAKTAAQNEALAGGGFLSAKENGRITTPGSLVGSAAEEATVRAPINSIISAEELGGYVDAIITALINQLTETGIDKLRGGLQKR